MKRWKFVLLAALAGLAAPVAAQNYPTKPVQVILAFTPGSAVDIVGRIVTAKLSEMWGQPVVNDNRAGAAAPSAPRRWRARHPTATRCSSPPMRTP